MWRPVSRVDYLPLNPKGQVLVVACPLTRDPDTLRSRWEGRACAVAPDSQAFLRDIVRDLLANPFVRALVFAGPACGRQAFDAFWSASDTPDWNIDTEHLSLVRQYVDLYDDDCVLKTHYQPFWPTRIIYEETLQ